MLVNPMKYYIFVKPLSQGPQKRYSQPMGMFWCGMVLYGTLWYGRGAYYRWVFSTDRCFAPILVVST